MSLLNKIFKARDKPTNTLNGNAYSFFFGSTTSGKAVNERSAMQMTAVYACVRILSEAVASLPMHLYRYNDTGGKEKAMEHQLYMMLHDEPNPEMSAFSFRETLMTHLLLWGNGFAQILRNGRGEVMGLYPLMPDRMVVDRDANGQLYYAYSPSEGDPRTLNRNSSVILTPSDVLHIPGLGFDVSCALVRPKAKKKMNRRALTATETKRVLETIKTHEHGLFLAVLYYLGLRRGEALGLKWGDFDWDDGTVHIQRDIDFTGSKAHEGDLKTDAAERYVPIPADLWKMLTPVRSMPDQFVFHTEKMEPLPQATYQRIWLSLMLETGCTEERKIMPETNRPRDIRKQYKPTITPHYFRHNYVTLLYEAGIDPLIAMKLVGHTDYQTTASIYTHLKDEALKKAATNIEDVFAKRQAGKVSKPAVNSGKWTSWGI